MKAAKETNFRRFGQMHRNPFTGKINKMRQMPALVTDEMVGKKVDLKKFPAYKQVFRFW